MVGAGVGPRPSLLGARYTPRHGRHSMPNERCRFLPFCRQIEVPVTPQRIGGLASPGSTFGRLSLPGAASSHSGRIQDSDASRNAGKAVRRFHTPRRRTSTQPLPVLGDRRPREGWSHPRSANEGYRPAQRRQTHHHRWHRPTSASSDRFGSKRRSPLVPSQGAQPGW